MKIEKYFIILILFTNFGFGQDSLSFKSNKTNSLKPNINGIIFGSEVKDTIYVYKNLYVLNEKEKNSIFDSIHKTKKGRKLFKNYKRGNNDKILNYDNHIFLMATFNSKAVSYKIKQDLLIDKIKFDLQSTTKKVKYVTYSDVISIPEKIPHISDEEIENMIKVDKLLKKRTVVIEKITKSKKKAIDDFLEPLKSIKDIDFSDAALLFIDVKKTKEIEKSNINHITIIRDNSSEETEKEIKELKIFGLKYESNTGEKPVAHGTNKKTGIIYLMYKKK